VPDGDLTAAVRAIATGDLRPEVGLILGSGLGDLAERIETPRRTSFGAVPGMPATTVVGHAGEFVIGHFGGRVVAAMRGRLHLYEGHSAATVTRPVRLLHALGCRTLIVSNAAGGINPAFGVGDLMAIEDHIALPGLIGHHPLVGRSEDRFVDMVGAYDRDLIERASRAASAVGIRLHRGVYAMVVGPSFETPAELRLLRTVGADAVGMSTALEVIVARQVGMRVLGISCITNQADPGGGAPVDHLDVLAVGRSVGARFGELVTRVIGTLPT